MTVVTFHEFAKKFTFKAHILEIKCLFNFMNNEDDDVNDKINNNIDDSNTLNLDLSNVSQSLHLQYSNFFSTHNAK